ncbi:MAG: MltA domain-containing protein [Pseudomonadota bacterium]|nr:MltA domain-containing protein [Pseudomonadota bacterium]NLX32022.1 transglycosylase [Deltaproteobacteria bacterium]HNU84426.1 MltA domain-containing protein [Syntrophales bacterium]HNZ34358.1 MltA domain-containing protein [Syntrophales bacterium]HOF73022.1 MltA domain-containing protein [Syntrophales bacterium]
MRPLKKGALLVLCCLLLPVGGCSLFRPPPAVTPPPAAPPKEAPPLAAVPQAELPEFRDDLDRESLVRALRKSLEYFARIPGRTSYRLGETRVTARDLKVSLEAFLAMVEAGASPAEIGRRVREDFEVYRAAGSGPTGRVLFTGYYEPVLEGSLARTDVYRYPIYRRPDDAVVVRLGKFREKYGNERLIGRLENGELVPYYSREEIDGAGALENRGLEIAWFADPVDIFFLHIQGSGMICPAGGSCFQVSYAQSNGRAYRSIGKLLIDSGKATRESLSMQGIRKTLRDNPDQLREILYYNESYVFFRTVGEGPVGSIGVALTGGRSIATDPAVFPRGALAFVKTRKPEIGPKGDIRSWVPFSRFVLNQDAGGAITGAGRVDLFCGRGREAEIAAGHLREEGELYFLVLKAEKRGTAR